MTAEQRYQAGVSLERYFDARLEGLSVATKLAADGLEKRLESMNGFREQLREQQAATMTREAFQIAHDRVLAELNDLREWRARHEGKASQTSVFIGYVIAVIALLLSIVDLVKHWG